MALLAPVLFNAHDTVLKCGNDWGTVATNNTTVLEYGCLLAEIREPATEVPVLRSMSVAETVRTVGVKVRSGYRLTSTFSDPALSTSARISTLPMRFRIVGCPKSSCLCRHSVSIPNGPSVWPLSTLHSRPVMASPARMYRPFSTVSSDAKFHESTRVGYHPSDWDPHRSCSIPLYLLVPVALRYTM